METLVILAIAVGLGFLLRKIWRGIVPKQAQTDYLHFKVKVKAIVFILVSIIIVFIFGYFIWTF